jgi:hypothetical protein
MIFAPLPASTIKVNRALSMIDFLGPDLFCLNNDYDNSLSPATVSSIGQVVRLFMEKHFPQPAPWEL